MALLDCECIKRNNENLCHAVQIPFVPLAALCGLLLMGYSRPCREKKKKIDKAAAESSGPVRLSVPSARELRHKSRAESIKTD